MVRNQRVLKNIDHSKFDESFNQLNYSEEEDKFSNLNDKFAPSSDIKSVQAPESLEVV
jgi:hypothetical protein